MREQCSLTEVILQLLLMKGLHVLESPDPRKPRLPPTWSRPPSFLTWTCLPTSAYVPLQSSLLTEAGVMSWFCFPQADPETRIPLWWFICKGTPGNTCSEEESEMEGRQPTKGVNKQVTTVGDWGLVPQENSEKWYKIHIHAPHEEVRDARYL